MYTVEEISPEPAAVVNNPFPDAVLQASYFGTQPFDEDTWKRIRIGAAEFTCFSPCARCVLTTVDPATGTVDKSGEPLRTLAQYRRNEGGVMFGMNLIPTALSTLRLGDRIEVIETIGD